MDFLDKMSCHQLCYQTYNYIPLLATLLIIVCILLKLTYDYSYIRHELRKINVIGFQVLAKIESMSSQKESNNSQKESNNSQKESNNSRRESNNSQKESDVDSTINSPISSSENLSD